MRTYEARGRDGTPAAGITIRESRPEDRAELVRLAGRDSAPLPRGRLLVADQSGELRAAVALDGSASIADPFRRTAEIVELLRLRVAQLRAGKRRRRANRRIATVRFRLPRRAAAG